MRKLKNKSTGNVYDCDIMLNKSDPVAIYWDGVRWTIEQLSNFVPAVPGIDY